MKEAVNENMPVNTFFLALLIGCQKASCCMHKWSCEIVQENSLYVLDLNPFKGSFLSKSDAVCTIFLLLFIVPQARVFTTASVNVTESTLEL